MLQAPLARPGDELWSRQFGLPAVDGIVTCAIFYQGALIIGGRFSQAGGVPAANIARWDGISWVPLGDGLDNDVLALFVFEDKLVVGGRFSKAGSIDAIGVALWDGRQWEAMGDGLEVPRQIPPAETSAFAEYGNALIATGGFGRSGGIAVRGIAQWDGVRWIPLGNGLSGAGRALAVWRDSLYVAGYFDSAGVSTAGSIAVWDRAAWSGVGGAGLTASGSTARAYSLALYGDRLIVGGEFDRAGDRDIHDIASWSGTEWDSLGAGSEWGVLAMTVSHDRLIVAGAVSGASLFEWDGASWSSGAPLPIGSASCLLPATDGLIVGGVFQASLTKSSPIRGFQIARWTGSDWIGFEPWTSSMHGLSSFIGGYPVVQSLASFRGELAAGGFLTYAGDPPTWRESGTVASWDDAKWHPVGDLATFGQTYTLLSRDDTLYAGGTLYGYHNGVFAMGLWRYDGATWSMLDTLRATIVGLAVYRGDLYVGARRSGSPAPFSGGVYRWDGDHLVSVAWMDPGIHAMAVHANKLVVAGDFTSIGGITAPGLAEWDGRQWQPVESDPPAVATITALAEWDGRLVAGGTFCAAQCSAVALLDSSSWQPLGNLDGHVACLTIANHRLFAGGWFGRPMEGLTGVVEWTGTEWNGLGSGLNGPVSALQEHDRSLYAGGNFTLAGGHSSFGIAQWNGLYPAPIETPRAPRLDAARPSPFRSTTLIPIALPAAGRVRVVVYDLSGRKVAVLEDAVRDAGDHSVVWNGRDDRGHSASSGLYFVQATMPGGLRLTRKLVLVR